jgi:hypothetical protein
VGTFNVNGKMPSQDLASWVGGRAVEKNEENQESQDVGKVIPPLKRLSSLSLGEIGADSATTNGSFYYGSFTTTFSYMCLLCDGARRICLIRNAVNEYTRVLDRTIHIVDSCYR